MLLRTKRDGPTFYSRCVKRVLAFVATFALLAPVTSASAWVTHHHVSTVTINLLQGSPDLLYGQVSGGPAPCRVGREVQLVGEPTGTKPFGAGIDLTSTNGDWMVSSYFVFPPLSHWQAYALKRPFVHDGIRHVCDLVGSPSIPSD